MAPKILVCLTITVALDLIHLIREWVIGPCWKRTVTVKVWHICVSLCVWDIYQLLSVCFFAPSPPFYTVLWCWSWDSTNHIFGCHLPLCEAVPTGGVSGWLQGQGRKKELTSCLSAPSSHESNLSSTSLPQQMNLFSNICKTSFITPLKHWYLTKPPAQRPVASLFRLFPSPRAAAASAIH